jgi:hypothetical protein
MAIASICKTTLQFSRDSLSALRPPEILDSNAYRRDPTDEQFALPTELYREKEVERDK